MCAIHENGKTDELGNAGHVNADPINHSVKHIVREHSGHAAKKSNTLIYVLLYLSITLILFNQWQINEISADLRPSTQVASQQQAISGQPQLTGNAEQDAIAIVLAKGVPPVYGPELGVSFDDPVASLAILKSLDPTYGNKKITLSGAELSRYIKIGTTPYIHCEFCCGTKSLVTQSGGAACGCAHAQAMRGLEAYLLKNHGSEYSDEQIMQQLAKWKAQFFPKQMVKRFIEQTASGQYTPDIAAILLGVDTSKLGTIKQADISSSLNSAPNMVGGC